MNDPRKVRRSDYRYAHRFLLQHPFICVALACAFGFIGAALYLDWFGHSALNPHWEAKNQIGACIAWAAAVVMAGYAYAGRGKQ